MSDSSVTITYVVKPWWKRFIVALEIAIFGSTIIEGEISNVEGGW